MEADYSLKGDLGFGVSIELTNGSTILTSVNPSGVVQRIVINDVVLRNLSRWVEEQIAKGVKE